MPTRAKPERQPEFQPSGERATLDASRLRLALDTIPAMVHSAQPDGWCDYFNQCWLDYLGVSLDDICGWKWTSTIHPEDVDAFVRKFRSGIRTGEAFEAEARVRRHDGVYRWMLHRKVPLRDPVGNVTHWYGSSVDIHDRKQTENALLLSQTYMAQAQQLAQIGSWAYRFSDEVHWYNPEHWSEELWHITDFDPSKGPPSAELIFSRIHPEDRPRVMEATNQTIKSGQALDVKYRYFRADGTLRVLRSIGAVTHLDDTVKRYVGATIDVTETERAVDELKRSELYLAEGQRLSHTGSWAWSPISNALLYWSEECFRILGYDPAQGPPSFESSFQRIHPEDQPVLAETIQRAVRDKAEFQIEYRLELPDGTRRNVRIHAHPVLDASGKLVEFVGTVIDITEQKLASQERHAHLWFLQSMDRINRAMQRSNDIEFMTSGVMQEALEIFGCDRAALMYPCDPDAPTFRTVMEHTSPEYGGTRSLGLNLPSSPEWMEVARRALQQSEAVVNPGVSSGRRERYHISSTLAIAVRPKGDCPYMFALHSVRSRLWTAAEVRLFEEIARRLEEALTSVLAHRNLLARERELRRTQHYLAEAQKLTHTGSWAWNPISNEIPYWSDECYRILDYDPALGIPSFESVVGRIHSEDRPAVLQAAQKAVAEKAIMRLEYRVILPGGITRTHRLLTQPELNASGELIEYLGTVVDITDQMRAEEEHRDHLWFLECMDRINRSMQRTNDVEPMTSGVVQESLAIFGCDRAWLVYPCDPNSPTCSAVMEQTRPEYPGAFALGEEFPVDQQAAEGLRRVLEAPGAVTDLHVAAEIRERFSIQSMIAIAVRPKGDRPYLFGLHQCAYVRTWTAAECRLFEEIARRLEDALTSVLAHRHLLGHAQELRISEQKYRHLVDTTPAFVHTALPTGDIDFFNRGWLEYLGIPISDLLGWRWTKAIHPEDVAELVQKWRASLESGTPLVAESRVRRADGEYRWFLHRKQPQRDEAGEIVKWYGSSIDIEVRKEAEEKLRRSEAFLADGQRLSQTGSWGWNARTGKLTWSQENFRILGFDPQSTTPSLDIFWERVHPDDRAALMRVFESAIREKRDVEAEYRIVTPDWLIRHLYGVGHAVLNAANELVEFVGSTVDVTERKRAEERARSHNEAVRLALNAFVAELNLDRFLDHLIVGLTKQLKATSAELWLVDDSNQVASVYMVIKQGRVVRPETAGGITGDSFVRWQPSNIGRTPRIIAIPAEQLLLQPAHFESLIEQGVSTLLVVPLVLGEQTLGALELRFQSATRFTDDDLDSAQALVHHATLALQLSRLAHRTEQVAVTEERNRLAREIHDTLAQAFAGIVLHGEALGASLGVSKARSRRALTNIKKLARSGLEEARRSVEALHPKALDGSTLPEALEDAVKRLSTDTQTTFKFERRGGSIGQPAEVQAELFRIAQEAMTNVRKHARATAAWIVLETTEDHVLLTVSDNGIGLAAANTEERKRGYGFATMGERAQRIGGRLEVESPAKAGTTVRVRIPLNGGGRA